MKKRVLNICNILGALYFILVIVVLRVPHLADLSFACKMAAMATAVLLIVMMSMIMTSGFAAPFAKKLSPGRVYAVCAIIMLTADVLIALSIKYVPVTDAKYMDIICRNFAQGRYIYAGLDEFHTHYLERYTNQWGLFLVQSLIYKISYGISGRAPHVILSFVNIAALQVSCYFVYKLVGKLFGTSKSKIICIVLMLFNPVLYGFSVIFYTDTLSMPFVTAALYFGASAFESKEKESRKFIFRSILAALCIGIGYCIKGNVAVVGTALVIYSLFALGIKRSLTFTALIVAGAAAVSMIATSIMYSLGAVDPEGIEKYGFPMSHWINMGLHGRGGYNDESFAFTYSLPDKQTRNEENIRGIKQYLSENSISAISKHVGSKVSYTWSDSAYQLTWQMRETPESRLRWLFSGSVAFMIVSYVFQCAMIICMLVSYISAAIRRHVDRVFIIRLTVFGLGLFLMLWETRSRYMLCFLPLFIIIMADGLEQITHLVTRIRKKRSGN